MAHGRQGPWGEGLGSRSGVLAANQAAVLQDKAQRICLPAIPAARQLRGIACLTGSPELKGGLHQRLGLS